MMIRNIRLWWHLRRLQNRASNHRNQSIEVLGKIGDERAIEPLIFALNDSSALTVWYAADALGELGDHRAVDALAKALESDNEDVRGAAALALGKIGGDRAYESVIALLERYELTGAIAESLGKLGNGNAIEPLTRALLAVNKSFKLRLSVLGGELVIDRYVEAMRKGSESLCSLISNSQPLPINSLRELRAMPNDHTYRSSKVDYSQLIEIARRHLKNNGNSESEPDC